MKTTVHTLLATIAISLTASAAPALLLETTFTDHADAGKDVTVLPRITIESGKEAMIKIDKLEYTITPTLLDDGSIDIHATVTPGGEKKAEKLITPVLLNDGTIDLLVTVTQGEDKKADKLVVPSLKTRFGKVATIQVGQLALTIKISLAK